MNGQHMHQKDMTQYAAEFSEEAVDRLNHLIRINLDSEQGFDTVKDNLKADRYQSLFDEIARERATQASELQGLVSDEGGKPESTGSLSGNVHRWWAQFRDAVTDSPNYGVLAEAERGEDKIVELYDEAMLILRDTPAEEVVSRHKRQVQQRHDQVRDLRDLAKEREGRG